MGGGGGVPADGRLGREGGEGGGQVEERIGRDHQIHLQQAVNS